MAKTSRRTKHSQTKRKNMVGVLLDDDEYKKFLDICNFWDLSYSSALRTIILLTHSRLSDAGLIQSSDKIAMERSPK